MDTDPRTNAILENAAWVRALARQLLADREAAEDVAQDALTLALDRPPEHTSVAGTRAWLKTVTRRLASQVGRREADRRHVETAASRDMALDPTGRIELQQVVARAVLELDEIYREVVVMRFFDDMPPREIARRLELPGPTVRKRLSRAKEQIERALRGRLGVDDTEWRAVLLTLARPGAGAAPPTASPLVPLAVGGAVLALGLVFAFGFGNAGAATALVLVEGRAGEPLLGARVFQVDGDDLVDLGVSDDAPRASSERGAILVVPELALPAVFPAPTRSGELALVMPAGASVRSAIYVLGEPPEEPFEMRLLVEIPRALRAALPDSAFDGEPLERDGDDLVFRLRTGDRGYFAFGGLPDGEVVRLLVPEDLDLDFRAAGEFMEGGVGLVVEAGLDLFWLGASPR